MDDQPEFRAAFTQSYPVKTFWDSCCHGWGNYEMVKEAEQVAIFKEWNSDGTVINNYHLSVQVQGWFQCHFYPPKAFEALSEQDLLKLVSDQIKDLESVAGIK